MIVRPNLSLVLGVIVSVLLCGSINNVFGMGGSGTEEAPYVIQNVTELQAINNYLGDPNVYFVLGNDIDASATINWNSGEGFVPIGNDANNFRGHFDGKGYKITGLYINRPTTDNVGLFGCIQAKSNNVGLVDVSVTGDHFVGGLVGRVTGYSLVESCYSIGTVNGYMCVGGLVGGGPSLPPPEGNAIIRNSYSVGNVNGDNTVTGGLVGVNAEMSVDKCYSTCDVYGAIHIGGLAGYNHNRGVVSNSSAVGSVSCSVRNVGGLVGSNTSAIVNSYSTGNVSGSNGDMVGGLVGSNELSGTCDDCFWDVNTSGKDTSACGIGKTTAEMMQPATFTHWDFNDVWVIHEGQSYPSLRSVVRCGDPWHPYPVGDLTGPDGIRDCRVDFYDFAAMASHWLEVTLGVHE